MAPEIVVSKLYQIARDREKELEEALIHLGKSIPQFSSHLIDELAL